MIGRRAAIALAVTLLAASLCPGTSRADPLGSIVGVVTGVAADSIDIKTNRQILHIALPAPFFAVYYQKQRQSLSSLALGMTVMISFTQSSAATEKRTAREIDILSLPN